VQQKRQKKILNSHYKKQARKKERKKELTKTGKKER